MFSRLCSYFLFKVKIKFFNSIHYNKPPSNPKPPPSNAPAPPPNCPPTNAPPSAVENGLACTCDDPIVVGNPVAIGDTKPAYCCNACAGANCLCLCIFSS